MSIIQGILDKALGLGNTTASSPAFDTNAFSSELSKHGVAKSHNFAVTITPPDILSPAIKAVNGWLPLRIESISMPSRSLMTTEQRYHGPIRYMPYSIIYSPVNITVVLSENMIERDFFMAWQDAAISAFGKGESRSYNRSTESGIYDSNYYDDAVGTLIIDQFPDHAEQETGAFSTALGVAQAIGIDPTPIVRPLGFDLGLIPKAKPPKPGVSIRLNECFPRTVNEVQMGWGNDELAKLSIEMIYFDISEKYNKIDTGAGNEIVDLVRKGIKAIKEIKPIVSGVRDGTLLRNIKSGAGSQLGNVKSNIKIF